MCLAIPGKVISINKNKATVDFQGIKRQVDLSLIEECNLGDFVLVHVGFAIQRVDADAAHETYRLLAEMNKEDMDRELRKNA